MKSKDEDDVVAGSFAMLVAAEKQRACLKWAPHEGTKKVMNAITYQLMEFMHYDDVGALPETKRRQLLALAKIGAIVERYAEDSLMYAEEGDSLLRERHGL